MKGADSTQELQPAAQVIDTGSTSDSRLVRGVDLVNRHVVKIGERAGSFELFHLPCGIIVGMFPRHRIPPCHPPKTKSPSIRFGLSREYGYHKHMFNVSFPPRHSAFHLTCFERGFSVSSHLSARRHCSSRHQRRLRSPVRALCWPEAGVGVHVFARTSFLSIGVAV